MTGVLRKGAAVFLAVAVVFGMIPLIAGQAHAVTVNPPTNVTCSNYYGYGEYGVKVTWTAPSSSFGYSYQIYRAPYTATDDSQFVKLNSANTTSYVDKTAVHGEKYKYAVASNDGNGHLSDLVKTAAVFVVNYTPVGKPAVGTATAEGNSVKLTWSGSDYNQFTIAEVQFSGLSYLPQKVHKTKISGTSCTITGLEYNKEYTFGVCYTNEYADGQYAAFSTVKTGSKPADTGSGSGSSGSGSSSGSSSSGSSSGGSSSSYTPAPPTWDQGGVKFISTVPGTVDITATSYDYVTVQVKQGSKMLINRYLAYYGNETVRVKIPYKGTTTFKYRLVNSSGGATSWKTKSVSSCKLRKTSLSVTKISAKSAGLSWSAVDGATGYKVYKGKKLIKTLGAKKTKYVYKKSKAGSAKYQVAAIIKSGGKTYEGPKCKAQKGKPNVRTYSGSKNYKSVNYGLAPYSITKIELKGNTYTVTGYALNNRIFKLLRYKKLEITLYCDGKKVAHKKWKNLKVNCKDSASKKIVLKIKGKGGKDFRNAVGTTYSASWTPYWETVGDKPF